MLRAPPGAGRLDRFLAEALPELSRARLQALVREGEVEVDGAPARPSTRLRGGEEVRVRIPPLPPSELTPEAIPLRLLYEDDDLVVLDKPAGLVVHPARGHRDGTLVNALLHALPGLGEEGLGERPGIVHRIDKGTSGLLVVARNDRTLRALQAAFAVHDIERAYLAVVFGVPRFLEGRIESLLGRHPRDRMRFASVLAGGKRAVTHWRKLGERVGVALLACELETGRTHQLRVHLSEAGHPIVGDALYRGRARLPAALQGWEERLDHQLLHAARLGFVHPATGARLSFEAAPPADFQAFCAEAGLSLP